MGAAIDEYTFPAEFAKEGAKTLTSVGAVEMYLQPLVNHTARAQLTVLAQTLRDRHVDFVAMVQAVDPDFCAETRDLARLGARSAQKDFARLKLWFEAGGTLAKLALDGPEKQILYRSPCRDLRPSLAVAVQVIVDYMTTMTSLIEGLGHPAPKFDIVVNFPNWNYAGLPKTFKELDYDLDYRDVLDEMEKAAKGAGLGLEGIEIDNPSPSPLGERMRLLRQQASRLGLKVGMIFNTYKDTKAVGPKACSSENGCNSGRRDYLPPDDRRDVSFLREVLRGLERWRAEIGEWPDYAIVETWMMHPRAILPETTLGTLSYDALAVKAIIDGGAPPFLSGGETARGCWSRKGDRVFGSALDPYDPATSIFVHVYATESPDVDDKTDVLLGSVPAERDCTGASLACPAGARHAFALHLPSSMRDKPLKVYAVGAGSRVLLPSANCVADGD